MRLVPVCLRRAHGAVPGVRRREHMPGGAVRTLTVALRADILAVISDHHGDRPAEGDGGGLDGGVAAVAGLDGGAHGPAPV